MTFRNLNGNWIDTLSRQYTQDLKDNDYHPIKYLLWNPQKNRNLFYLVAAPIHPSDLRKSLVKYHRATKDTTSLEWENEHVKIWPHPGDLTTPSNTGLSPAESKDED